MIAPYDTGNSRRAITLKGNTSKKITIGYNTSEANYIKFLEEGIGPVKKYKGYIGDKTRLAIVEELMFYLQTGQKPMFTSTPHVTLRSSKSVFSTERKYLNQADMHTNAITQKARNTISKIRETKYRKAHGLALNSFTGKKVSTSKMNGQNIRGSVRGISALSQAYKETRRLN
jgi:small nuclear ribonucleoprotein (snRNP)-like protein